MKNRNQPVALEGYPFIALFAFITIVFGLLGLRCLTTILFLLTLFTVYFFRNPERQTPDDEGAVIAPADGKVVFAGEVVEERFMKGEVKKLSIFMSVFNVHVNRVPLAGKVVDTYYNKGEFLNAAYDKASLKNEQAGILLETKSKQKILFVQIAGLIARRIVSYPVIGDVIKAGDRYGLIRFGSRVDIYLPKEADLKLMVGDKAVAGETIIATMPEKG